MSFTTNSIEGEYRHYLSIGELPWHAHKPHGWDLIMSKGGITGLYTMTYMGDNNKTGLINAFNEDSDQNRYTSYVGNNESHCNTQPSITVFFWRRLK